MKPMQSVYLARRHGAEDAAAAVTAMSGRRRGTALIVVIICLVLITGITTSLVRLTLAAHAQLLREEHRLQASWLAEAALQRGKIRLQADSSYTGEVWAIESIGPAGLPGRAVITMGPASAARDVPAVEPAASPEDRGPGVRELRVMTEFPLDPSARIRIHRTQTLAAALGRSSTNED
jgi:hypothetical protein